MRAGGRGSRVAAACHLPAGSCREGAAAAQGEALHLWLRMTSRRHHAVQAAAHWHCALGVIEEWVGRCDRSSDITSPTWTIASAVRRMWYLIESLRPHCMNTAKCASGNVQYCELLRPHCMNTAECASGNVQYSELWNQPLAYMHAYGA